MANVAAWPQTGSTYVNEGTPRNRTGVALSTMILIKVNNVAIGAVQKLDITEDKSVTMIDEVGSDGHIDSAPTKSANIKGSCERIRYDKMRITESFMRGFLHVKSQRIPFDIEIIDQYTGAAGSGTEIITTIENVWITQLSYGYTVSDWIVKDSMSWEAESISSRLGASQLSAATGGSRGLSLDIDPYEQAADTGKRRGAMDAPDLLNAVFAAA